MSTKRVPTDPAVRPIADSDRWFETGPEPIWNDEETAVLMVRVGMAQNALVAEMDAASLANRRHSHRRSANEAESHAPRHQRRARFRGRATGEGEHGRAASPSAFSACT